MWLKSKTCTSKCTKMTTTQIRSFILSTQTERQAHTFIVQGERVDEISPRIFIVIRQKRIFSVCTELYKVMKEVLGLHDKVKCLFVGYDIIWPYTTSLSLRSWIPLLSQIVTIQSTLVLRTPPLVRTLAITDKIQIPGESYRVLTGNYSRYYGLSLLRNYGRFRGTKIAILLSWLSIKRTPLTSHKGNLFYQIKWYYVACDVTSLSTWLGEFLSSGIYIPLNVVHLLFCAAFCLRNKIHKT